MRKLIALWLPLLVLIAACQPANEPTLVPTPKSEAAAPKAAGWEEKWQTVLAAAKKEGQVTVYSQWGPETRNLLIKEFKDKYGINVEWLAFSRGPEITARVSMENRAGIYNAD